MFLERVAALIASQKITRNKLLMDLNLDKSSFFNWERRGTIPSGDVVAKIAEYFHVSTDYLLGRTDDPSPVGEEKGPTLFSEEEPPGLSELTSIYNSFNDEGREKLLTYAKDLDDTGRYIKTGVDRLGKAKDA